MNSMSRPAARRETSSARLSETVFGNLPVRMAALDSSLARSNNDCMNLLDRVENGVIVVDLPVPLPEGARVFVSFPAKPPRSARAGRPVALPIFDYDGPLDIDLTNERIAEILDRDGASA
jgi:hypothetical protein